VKWKVRSYVSRIFASQTIPCIMVTKGKILFSVGPIAAYLWKGKATRTHIWSEDFKGERVGNLGIDGGIILKRI